MQRTCFVVPGRLPPEPIALRLDDNAAEALGQLLPLLGCGEEAAALAFDGLSGKIPAHADLFASIASDERVHDALLQGVLTALPASTFPSSLTGRIRRMHLSLGAGGDNVHCVRIAALDSAVCTILTQLLCIDGPIFREPRLATLFARIRDDEARHVAVTRRIALASPISPVMRDAAAATRLALADILTGAGAAFDALNIDPDRLLGKIARLPTGLLRA